jgi:hypothetical protein
VTSEISSSAKGVIAVPGDSIAATDPFTGSKESPATPRPATPKVVKAFFDRFALVRFFICDMQWFLLHHQPRKFTTFHML